MERRAASEGRLETVTMFVVYLVREILFLSRESLRKALFWTSSFVSNSNPCIVGNKSCLEFKTELMLNTFIKIIFDMLIFFAITQFYSPSVVTE